MLAGTQKRWKGSSEAESEPETSGESESLLESSFGFQ
jgi:hypothetical protein